MAHETDDRLLSPGASRRVENIQKQVRAHSKQSGTLVSQDFGSMTAPAQFRWMPAPNLPHGASV
eukprot:4637625-Pleurochrysis_carterae.AAC.1